MVSRRKFMAMTTASCAGLLLSGTADSIAATAKQTHPLSIPPGGCDCHVHIVGPASKYPMLADRAYTPPEASVAELRAHLAALNLQRVVIIQPSFYGTNNDCLVDALKELGNAGRGIAVIDENTSNDELKHLAAHGVRGVRVNLESIGIREPAAAQRALSKLADRIGPLGWHIQIYAAMPVIAAVTEQIANLSVPVVLDHFASMPTSVSLDDPRFKAILSLVRTGKAYVKLSAPYRVSKQSPIYGDVVPMAKMFIDANIDRMLWASDWPHTDRAPNKAPTEISPYRVVDDASVLGLLGDWAGSRENLTKILVTNPEKLYGFK